jgi:hypothetical protein
MLHYHRLVWTNAASEQIDLPPLSGQGFPHLTYVDVLTPGFLFANFDRGIAVDRNQGYSWFCERQHRFIFGSTTNSRA